MREIGIVHGEVEVWAFAPNHAHWRAQDGKTPRKAARAFVKKHPQYVRGFGYELVRYETFPPGIRVNYNT